MPEDAKGKIVKEDEYYHVRLRDPDKFSKMRTIDIDEDKGIKAVVGKESKDSPMKLQNLMFTVDNWSRDKVRKWIKDHKDTIKQY